MRPDAARTVAAYTALVLAASYGAMKLQWALGGEFLMAQTPLPTSLRDDLLGHGRSAILGHVGSVALAMLGVAAALCLAGHFGPLGRLRRRVLLVGAWSGCVLMAARALGLVGYGFINDVRLLGGFVSVPSADEAASRYEAWWDLLLWSPFWLLFAMAWGFAAWRYGRPVLAAAAPATRG